MIVVEEIVMINFRLMIGIIREIMFLVIGCEVGISWDVGLIVMIRN